MVNQLAFTDFIKAARQKHGAYRYCIVLLLHFNQKAFCQDKQVGIDMSCTSGSDLSLWREGVRHQTKLASDVGSSSPHLIGHV